jgi:hypothetical protein
MYKSGNIKIQECILNIDMVCRNIYLSYEESVGLKLSRESTIWADLLKYRYIQLCTILDEIEILHSLANEDSYLKDTLYVISPVTKALSQFNGIKRARNFMFAHYNRDKKKQFYPWWISMRNLKVPQTQQEVSDIYKYLHIMNAFLVARYYYDLNEIIERTRPDYELFFKLNSEKIRNSNSESIFENINKEVEEKMIERGISNQLILDPVMTNLMTRINKSQENINLNKK